MLDKQYDAKKYEDAIYKKWEESGAFIADVNSTKPSFTISMPPPNATGVLHLGHSVMLALEDIMIRHRRMKGYEVLYVPGTDHAAIATESVVIKNLQAEGLKDPRSLGREKLVEKIAEFVAKSQSTIRSQIRKMGTSCDWSREAYTMDVSLNRCVNEVFKKMYEDGLIYRAERVVNWDVALQTTLADDEVEYKEQEGTLYTIEYLTAEQTGGEPIYVSTSRPETKLGDNALAINPEDERYKHLIGKDFDVIWPGGQKINVTVIADHEVDKDFGSGVLGVTPFHSKIDYDMWLRHKQEIKTQPLHVINEQGKITTYIQNYEGLSVHQAREKFVEELRAAGRLKEEKKYMQQMSISYRSKKPVEPLPKLQWFIDVNKKVVQYKGSILSLKEVMQQVVNKEEIKIIPERFEKTYFHWIDNLQDWCISRQIWWGHRIPVWQKECPANDTEIFSILDQILPDNLEDLLEKDKGVNCVLRIIDAETGERLQPEFLEFNHGLKRPIIVYVVLTDENIGKKLERNGFIQDSDTLDTWFSSALWTWSTLVDKKLLEEEKLLIAENPTGDFELTLEEILKRSPDFQKFHPTQVMETGYDILFFWVARMILMTTYTIGEVPFETVYLHGLIRTREGKKMSKSDPKTCIDPLDMIELYGADALRMSMVIGNSPGNDMRLYEEKIKGYRNFTNKLWNASRFVLGAFEEKDLREAPELDFEKLSDADQWILAKLNSIITSVDEALMEYKISEAGQLLYDFLWNDFCDWYLELSKGQKQNLAVLHHVLKNILILLHPIIPFVTEQIWSEMPGDKNLLIKAAFPSPLDGKFEIKNTEMTIEIISTIRRMRSENKIEAVQKIPLTIYANLKLKEVEKNQEDIIRLSRLSELTLKESGEKLDGAATDMISGIEIYLPLSGLVDTEKEKERLRKEIINLNQYIESISDKLLNTKFIQNAPVALVEGERKKLEVAVEKQKKMEEQLNHL